MITASVLKGLRELGNLKPKIEIMAKDFTVLNIKVLYIKVLNAQFNITLLTRNYFGLKVQFHYQNLQNVSISQN